MKIKWKLALGIAGMLFGLNIALGVVLYAEVTGLINSRLERELVNYSKMGLTLMDTQYPGNWHVENGTLYKGSAVINDDLTVVDRIKKEVDIMSTVFLNDTRITTSLQDEQGKRIVGTKANPGVVQAVLQKGEDFQGDVQINGKMYKTHYTPIKDGNGKIIGMWFVGVSHEEVVNEIAQALVYIIVAISVILFIGIIFSVYIGGKIGSSLKLLIQDIEVIASGDFTGNISEKTLKRKDEIGNIAASVDRMKKSVRSIIKRVVKETNTIEETVNNTVSEINQLHENIKDISATTDELASAMEETSTGAEEMSATSHEIEGAIGNVAKRAQEGMNTAREIKHRAEGLKINAFESQKNANKMYRQTQENLRASIDKSKSIEKIKSLTEAILAISSQTNLLALNAAIEASRAGESGKGFAVVADEIRKLAEDSKNTVGQIQIVVKEVTESVENLVKDSENVLEFVDNQVIKDYEMLVKTGEQYSKDADYVDDLMSGFSETSQQLHVSLDTILKVIDEITHAANEGAGGATNIAERAATIVEEANAVSNQAQITKNSTDKLIDRINEFKV